MELIKEVWDKDIDPSKENAVESDLEVRETVRVVLLNENNQIGILELANVAAHDLPGGGIDPGEDHEMAAKREVLEETGFGCEILQEIGYVLEYKKEYNVKQFSYAYLAKVVGDKKQVSLTENESSLGMKEIEWMSIDRAIGIFESDKPSVHDIKHLVFRDLLILKRARCLI